MSTVPHRIYTWRDNGLRRSINHALVMMVRETKGANVARPGARSMENGLREAGTYRTEGAAENQPA